MPALIERKSIDYLFIGSSTFKNSLDIHLLDDSYSDENYYILSYNGNNPQMEYIELKHLLTNNVNIKNLFIDMYVYTLFDPSYLEDEKIFLELDLGESYELWHTTRKTSDNHLASFSRAFITANNELLLTWPISKPILYSQFHNGGFTTYSNGVTDEYLQNLDIPYTDIIIDEQQKQALLDIVNITKKYNINLTFIETPKYILEMKEPSYIDAMNKYKSFLDSLNVNYITSDDYLFDTSNARYFNDIIHLSGQGRIEFSKELVKCLSMNNNK